MRRRQLPDYLRSHLRCLDGFAARRRSCSIGHSHTQVLVEHWSTDVAAVAVQVMTVMDETGVETVRHWICSDGGDRNFHSEENCAGKNWTWMNEDSGRESLGGKSVDDSKLGAVDYYLAG